MLVAQTPPVVAGTYFISASTLLDVASGDGAYCYVATANGAGLTPNYGGAYNPSTTTAFAQASNTNVVTVVAGDSIELWCYDHTGGSTVYNSAITATLIGSVTASPALSKATVETQGAATHLEFPPSPC